MSSQSTGKNWFEAAFEHARLYADGARGYARPAIARAGAYAGGARRWSAVHLPGGERTLWIGLGLILLGLLLWAIQPGQKAQSGRYGSGGPMPVGVAKATRGDIAITLNALGTVTPLATVTVRPQVSGQLMTINFREGQMVKAGDVLAEIDPRTFQAAYDQARGQLDRDRASLANAIVDLKRDQALYAVKATSQQILATQQALVRQDEGIVKSDGANVEAAAINLGYTKITAPVSGRAGLRQVDVGNIVQAGQTTGVVVITQLQPMSVVFALPEDNIGDIMGQVNAGATLSVDAYDRGQTVKLASGTLATVDNEIDPTTGTVKMRAMFDNTDATLFPNQFVNMRLLVNTLHGQIFVPASAIERGAEGSFVYVVQTDSSGSTVAMRTVTLGPQDGERVAILKGLNPGDLVVTDGADRLRDGSEVTIPKGQKAGAPAAGQAAAPSGDARAARRAALNKVCGDDIKKYCGSADGYERFQCMREHQSDFSAPCQAAMSKMHRGGGGGRGGP
jgi:multidrug efflux system membrane fusion protein